MSNKSPVAEMETKYPTIEAADALAGAEIPLDQPNPELSLEGPPTLHVDEFEHDIGAVVELPPSDSASPFERLIDENNLLPVWFLERGVMLQKAVARVVLTQSHRSLAPGRGWGTGFMVSDSLFLTNNHVVKDKAFMDKFRVQFNYQLDHKGIEQTTESFLPAADDIFHTNAALDYSLFRLQPNQELANGDEGNGEALAGKRWGSIPLNAEPNFHQAQHFNIIQHPNGRRKEIALHDNQIAQLRMNAVRYTSDTEPGSSGSPVFNNLWELVALHHAGGAQDASGTWINNQGIRLDRIVADLQQHFADRDDIRAELGI